MQPVEWKRSEVWEKSAIDEVGFTRKEGGAASCWMSAERAVEGDVEGVCREIERPCSRENVGGPGRTGDVR